MHGFQGFADVVKRINLKLSNSETDPNLDTWAVNVDYNSTTPVVEQINHKVVSTIKRVQVPVLGLMRLFGIQGISSYCGTIDSINDICFIYVSMSKQSYAKFNNAMKKLNPAPKMRRK